MTLLRRDIVRDTYLWWGIVLIGCITLTEIVSIWIPPLGRAGVIWWVMAFLYLGIYAASCVRTIFHTSRAHKTPFTVVAIMLFVVLIGVNLSNPNSVNGENTQEITCTLDHFSRSADWGFRQTCLFGYPARQYSVPALSSLIFGRSVGALNTGGAVYFLIGLVVFLHGLLLYFPDKRKSDMLGLLFTGALLHFRYVNHFLFLFEQSVFPLSFGLIGAGIWMHYQTQKNIHTIIPMGVVLMYISHAYTPALSLLVPAFVFLLYYCLRAPEAKTRFLFRLVTAVAAISALVSLGYRHDLDFGHGYTSSLTSLLRDLSDGLRLLLPTSPYAPYTTQLFAFMFLPLILLPLIGVSGRWAFGVSVWIICVFVMTVYAKGFTYYGLPFRLHRFLVIVPVLFTLVAAMIKPHAARIKPALLAAITMIIFVTGLLNYRAIQLERPYNPHYRFIQWLQHHKIPQNTTIHMTDAPNPINNLISVRDTMQYFYPDIHVDFDTALRPDCTLPDSFGLYIVPTDGICTAILLSNTRSDPRVKHLGSFSSDGKESLIIVQRTR